MKSRSRWCSLWLSMCVCSSVVKASDIELRLRWFRCEPTLRDVITAWKGHEPMHQPDWSNMIARARSSAWLPQMRWSMRYGRGVDWHLYADDQARWNTGTDIALTGGLWFQLDRLIFSNDELGVLRESRMHAESLNTRLQHLIKLFYERKRLLVEQMQPDGTGLAALPMNAWIRVQEIEAALDLSTGGVLSRRWSCVPRR